MTPLPKPTQRPSRPRRPLKRTAIARSRTPIARRARVRSHGKSAVAKLVREADRLFSLLIRRPRMCRRCNVGGPLDCAHHISRRYTATRWHLDNASPLCRPCAEYYTKRPKLWAVTWRRWVGDATADQVTALAAAGAVKSVAYMTAIVAGLKACGAERDTQ